MMRLVYSLFLLWIGGILNAQHPYYYSIDHEDGLPSDEVYQVVQDKFGFVWIGSDAGLYRYDGIYFKEYQHSKQNSKSISNLQIDRHNNLWCQNFTGQIFMVRNDSLVLFDDQSAESKLIPEFTIDEFDRVWIINNKKVRVLNSRSDLVRELTPAELPTGATPYYSDIIADGKGHVYITDLSGSLFCISTVSFGVSRQQLAFSHLSKHRFYKEENRIYLHAETDPEREYILAAVSPAGNSVIKKFGAAKVFSSQYFIKKAGSETMIGTSDGVIRLNDLQGSGRKLFPGYKVSDMMIDKEGNYWFTTLQNGILIIPGFEINEYTKSNSALQDENISTISLAGDQLIIGNYSGRLYYLDIRKETIAALPNDNVNNPRAVRKVIKTPGLFLAARGLFSNLNHPSKQFPALNNIRDFVLHNDTLFFVSSDKTGYALMGPSGPGSITVLQPTGGRKVIYDSASGAAVYACNSGLYQLANNSLTEITNGSKKIFATDLEYYKRKVFAGTVTDGVIVISNNRVADHFSTENGLSHNHVKCLGVYNDYLFCCNKYGIQKISLDNKQQHLLNTLDGVSCLEVNEMAFSGNRLFLATIRGLIVVPLNFEKVNTIAPEIRITGVSVNEKNRPMTDHLTLSWNDRNIIIRFIATAFRSRGSFQYQYRLKNFNDNWQTTGNTSPQATFLSIPEGEYEFEVVALNEDGVASTVAATIHITVRPPFWKKWWFFIPVILLLTAFILLVFTYRLRKIRQQEKAKSLLIQSQLTALKAQMNPHFMFNALNSVQSLVLANDIKNANYYLGQYSTLTRKILGASDNDRITVEEEISILSLYLELEKLRFGNEFSYRLTELNCGQHLIPSMIIQPFVENAVKHGLLHKKGEKRLTVQFEKSGDNIICTIEDNGIGVEKALEIKKRSGLHTHQPYGTKATLRRIELINSTLKSPMTVTTGVAASNEQYPGTRVVIVIPV